MTTPQQFSNRFNADDMLKVHRVCEAIEHALSKGHLRIDMRVSIGDQSYLKEPFKCHASVCEAVLKYQQLGWDVEVEFEERSLSPKVIVFKLPQAVSAS